MKLSITNFFNKSTPKKIMWFVAFYVGGLVIIGGLMWLAHAIATLLI